MSESLRSSNNTGSQVQATNRITGNRRWWALGAVLLTIFFASLDQTVVATAMPNIIGDLKGFNLYAWVFTAYMMASAVTVPIYGKLSDVFGRKPFYIFGLTVFMVGSMLSGQSHSMLELILFRALQGIGAGAMLSMPRATIGDIFNPRERGQWMGVISMAFGLASIVGPFMGGWITDTWGWRWIFYINLPVALLALVLVVYTLPTVRIGQRVKIDWMGSLLLIAGLIPMLLAFTWAGNQYAWNSLEIIGLLAFSAVMLLIFVLAERRASEPIIPIEFFKRPIFFTTNLVGLLLSVGLFGTMMFLPLYIQGVMGMSAANSGALLTPMMFSFIIGATLAGQVMTRTGTYKVLAIVSAVFMTVGLFLFTRLTTATTLGGIIADMLVMGLGIGGLMPILNVAVQNAFPYRVMGVVNAAQQFVRSLAGVIAAPILGTVMVNVFAAQMKVNLPGALKAAMSNLPAAQQKIFTDPQSLTSAAAQMAIKQKFEVFGPVGDRLYHQFISAVRESLSIGMAHLFWIAFLFGAAALLVTFLLPALNLKHDEFFEEPDA